MQHVLNYPFDDVVVGAAPLLLYKASSTEISLHSRYAPKLLSHGKHIPWLCKLQRL